MPPPQRIQNLAQPYFAANSQPQPAYALATF